MAISEADRRRMRAGLIEVLGEEAADVLMEHLPSQGWADLATRQDVDQAVALLSAELHTELAGVRSELRTELAGVRIEMANLASALRAEMVKQSRTMTATMVGSTAFLASVLSVVSAYSH